MNLRDHDDTCIHGFHHYHDRHDPDTGDIHESCFGGAAVDIDYEAADAALDDIISVVYGASGRYVVDAALRLTND